MPSQSWSIERELCKLAGDPDPQAALAGLGLIQSPTATYELTELQPWARSGSETYSFVFSVVEAGGKEQTCRLKACVAFTGAQDLETTLRSWLRRRKLLSTVGVNTPHLFGAGHGVLLEEEIPLDVAEAMGAGRSSKVLSGLVDIAAALTRLKFSPVAAFGDVRSRGDDAVFVDFGSDLGDPVETSNAKDPIFRQLLEQLARWRIELSSEEKLRLRESYETRIVSKLQ